VAQAAISRVSRHEICNVLCTGHRTAATGIAFVRGGGSSHGAASGGAHHASSAGLPAEQESDQHVIVVGIAGEQIGTVERFEIDKSGRLKCLVVRIASSLGTRKRIASEHIRSIQNGTVSVAISATDVRSLVDDREPDLDALWSEDPIFEQPVI
jgi:hypothetical protein